MATPTAANRPDYQRPEYKAALPARQLCQALMLGTAGVRALGQIGLPKWPAEKPKNYKIRAAIVQVARYYQRTVQAATGMIVATPPKLDENADPTIIQDAEDIDGKGTHLEVFARGITTDAINGGFAAILVDCPPVPDGIELTYQDQTALDLRPFWTLVTADQIVSWIIDVPDWKALLIAYKTGQLTADQVKAYARQTILRQVVIHEPTDVTDGDYGVKTADRYRRLQLTDAGVIYTVFEHVKEDKGVGEHFNVVDTGAMMQGGVGVRQPFREIPLAIVYAGRKAAAFVAEPPLLPLCELNLDHYQVSADRRYLMRLCHAPTLFIAGVDDVRDEETGQTKRIEVGPNSIIRASDSSAKAEYVVAPSDALTSSKEEKDELVRQMAALGMAFLDKDQQRAAETATGRQLDDAAENATHATVARGLQDGLEQALKFHAMYRGVDAPEIVVNTTYASPTVDPQIAAVLWQAVAADKLDVESWVEYIKTGDLPDDIEDRLDVMRIVAAQNAADAATAQANTDPSAKADPALKAAA